jgi:hypothetical protein
MDARNREKSLDSIDEWRMFTRDNACYKMENMSADSLKISTKSIRFFQARRTQLHGKLRLQIQGHVDYQLPVKPQPHHLDQNQPPFFPGASPLP